MQEVKSKEYVPRPAMLGLGAKPSEILQRPPKKHIRQVSPQSLALSQHPVVNLLAQCAGEVNGSETLIRCMRGALAYRESQVVLVRLAAWPGM